VLQQELDELEFAVKNIVTVAERRKDSNALAECHDILGTLRHFLFHREGEDRTEIITGILEESLHHAYHIADNLAMITMVEIREVLFPLPGIKQQARQFGKNFFSNYFGWLDDPDQYSPEQLMGLLEGDLRKLEQAKNLLTNTFISLHTNRVE
jgi:hypothetical protein